MADPKNKWAQPGAPPAPMFFGEKERNLVKQINDELAERILGQPIAYYPISIEESNFNDTYGEATEKISLPPIRVYAYVTVENEQTNDRYGYEYQTKLTVSFNEKRITADQNLYVRVGDFIQYGDLFYEIVRTYNDTRYYFGQVEHKFQISAECVRAREGAFRVTPSVDRPTERSAISGEGPTVPPRPAPYPPLAASYITVFSERKLPNERVLAAGVGIELLDGGAGGDLTISAPGGNAQGIAGAVQLQDSGGVFAGSSNLVFLTGSDRLGVGTATPATTLHLAGTDGGIDEAFRISGTGPKIQFDENDSGAGKFQIQAQHGMLKWQVQNSSFDAASVKWMMNSDGQMAFRDGAAGAEIPARIYISGSGNSNLLQISSSAAADILVVTGSGKVGIGTADPSHTLTVIGAISASANVSASYFYGDGRHLTGVTASATVSGDGPVGALQFKEDESGEISGSSKILYNIANNSLTVDAGLIHNRTTVITTYTASTDNYLLGVTGVPTEILFDATSFAGGQVLVIKDESGGANSANTITLNASASQTIDGASSIEIESPYGSVLIYSNGSNWFIY